MKNRPAIVFLQVPSLYMTIYKDEVAKDPIKRSPDAIGFQYTAEDIIGAVAAYYDVQVKHIKKLFYT